MNRLKYLIPLSIYTLLLWGCSPDHFDDISTGESVRFNVESLDKDLNTRAAGTTLNDGNPLTSMGIYAAYTTDSWTGAAPINYMTNQLVNRPGANQVWGYSPEQFWPGSGYLSFFAYAPYNAAGTSVSGTSGIPSIRFTVDPDQANQIDLLVAKPMLNQTKQSAASAVTIPLRHALTKIGFSARVSNAPASGTAIVIKKIELVGLYASGTSPMDGGTRSWTPEGAADKIFAVSSGGGLRTNFELTDSYQQISSDNGYLFLMPQTINASAKVKISYEMVTNGGALIEEKIIELPKLADAISQFKPGEAYNMMFSINNGVTLIVAPMDWNKMTVDADIYNRILNVSRIQAMVYDAAVTRIYFWSNQPKDSVHLEVKGRVGDVVSGTEFDVDNLYQDLSGKSTYSNTTPRVNNIVYRGIDEAAAFGGLEKGEGYLDIIHKGGLPPASGQTNHIYLNSSGLVRSIKLNSTDSPADDTDRTPYIGTFHRRNEMSERLIRWATTNATDTWTAEVLNTPSEDENSMQYTDFEDVIIDRWASPAMLVGSLYSNNPLDPQFCLVEGQAGDWSKQKVSGTGTVYFRVGWTKPAPTNRVRYARIKVTVKENGTGNETAYLLHLRQGHLEDYVMRPTDNTRANAVKWSPYNMRGGNLKDTENSFVSYPTQAGYFYLWANATHPGFGFVPQGNAANWSTNIPAPGIFWPSLSGKHESCPAGYRRPVSGSLTTTVGSDYTNCEFKQSLIEVPSSANNQLDNTSAVGYYADGFFDRRKIENHLQVSGNTSDVAYFGRLFYNNESLASLFLPAAGYRDNASTVFHTLGGIADQNYLGVYLSASLSASGGNAQSFSLNKNSVQVSPWSKYNGLSLRCVHDIPYNTTVVDWKPSYTPVMLEYNNFFYNPTNPLLITLGAGTIAGVMGNMMLDINKLPSGQQYLFRARMTLCGTAEKGTHVISVDRLTDNSRIGPGSTFAFAFTDGTKLDFNGSVFQILIPQGWEGVATIGGDAPDWTAAVQGNGATSAISLYGIGTLVVRKK